MGFLAAGNLGNRHHRERNIQAPRALPQEREFDRSPLGLQGFEKRGHVFPFRGLLVIGALGAGDRPAVVLTRVLGRHLNLTEEFPSGFISLRQRLIGHAGADHFDRDGPFVKDRVVEFAISHLAGVDDFLPQRSNLQAAEHVGRLIERTIASAKRPPHLRGGVFPLVANAIHQKVNALLGRHLAKMKVEGKDDSSATMHAPKEHPNAVFRRTGEPSVPKQGFPVKRPTLDEKGGSERPSVGFVPLRHEPLKMMAGDQFVVNRRP